MSEYVRGPSRATKRYATFETKSSAPTHTGGGYERWRSTEVRPETPRRGAQDAFVTVHRLTAVVACYDIQTPLTDVLTDLREKDVHHLNGVPWDNSHGNLETVAHGRHSEITQAQQRAWAEDKKREMQERENEPLTGTDRCDNCGTEGVTLATSDGFSGEYCLPCAKAHSDGNTINV